MGSLSSRPQVPTTTPVVFVPQTTSTTTTSTTGATDAKDNTDSNNSSQTGSGTRSQSLLERNRGRFGTIQTSFRGLLSIADAVAGRKTLLGE